MSEAKLSLCSSGAAGQGADMGQHRLDGVGGPGDGAVDALMRQQQRAFDPVCVTDSLKRRAQGFVIRELGEVVECCDNEF